LTNNSFEIFAKVEDLPENWNQVARQNVFLQTSYLNVLQQAAPINMTCYFIGIYENSKLIGVAIAQHINLNYLQSFGTRDSSLKNIFRNFVFKNWASQVLFIGNNTVTGQNAFTFETEIPFDKISVLLKEIKKHLIVYLKSKNCPIHLVSIKDFYQDCASELKNNGLSKLYSYESQPNMIFYLNENWCSMSDYVASLSRKYRDQYKRATKKAASIQIKNLTFDEIVFHQERLYDLYLNVAKNAPFNTFFLPENHFSALKKQCQDKFLLYGYFNNDELVGFHTVFVNGTFLETYFLGYDSEIQKDKMLYLNMLYNMTAFGIEQKYKTIIFGRTALEIKSAIGAIPIPMTVFVQHRRSLIHFFIAFLIKKVEPKINWQIRHPFQ